MLLIQGSGTTPSDTSKATVVHNAVAMITHDQGALYHSDAYAAGHGMGDHKAEFVAPQHFRWYMETPRGQMRYSILVDAQGMWKETGEFKTGSTRFPFFEMILEKK